MALQFAPTNATMDNKSVQELLKEIRMSSGKENPTILGVNTQQAMYYKNGGFPKHLHHPTLRPVIVLTEKELNGMQALGFVENYIHHDYPRWKFRRNLELIIDRKTGEKVARYEGFVEAVTVDNADQEKALSAKKAPAGCSEWVDVVTILDEIAPLPEQTLEDPKVTEARLEGQLAAMQAEINAMRAQHATKAAKSA